MTDAAPAFSRWVSTKALALILGALLTPVAMGLSLAALPIGGALLLYALLAGAFAYREPQLSWQWGLWPAGGMVLASVLVLIVLAIMNQPVDLSLQGGFIEVTLLFALAPALVGGCLGGVAGSLASQRQYSTAGALALGLLVVAVALPFIG